MLEKQFNSTVSEFPNKTAVIAGDDRITYLELANLIRICMHNIYNVFGEQKRIGLVADQDIYAIIFILAAIFCGKTVIPIDPRFDEKYIEKVLLRLTEVTCINEDVNKEFLTLKSYKLKDLFVDNGTKLDINIRSKRDAYILHTSGTTDTPKAVIASDVALCKLVNQLIERYFISSSSHIVQFSYLSFDSSFAEIWCSVLAGATLVLPGLDIRDNLFGTLEQISKKIGGITITLPPSVAVSITDNTLANIETLILAGEECPTTLANNLCGGVKHLINAYGPTESIICATTFEINNKQKTRVPIGRPLEGMRITLDNFGQMILHGDYLADGYVGAAEDAFSIDENGRYYITGDLATVDDSGNYIFRGRIDNQIKLNGQRIEIEGLESIIRNGLGVSQIFVTYLDDGVRGFCCVFINRAEHKIPALDKINKLLPANIRINNIISIDNMPTDKNGKTDRKELQKIAHEQLRRDKKVVRILDKEDKLLSIWDNVFGGRIAIDMSTKFFDIGGDSLLALKLISLINNNFNTSLRLIDLINNDTPRDLMVLIEGAHDK